LGEYRSGVFSHINLFISLGKLYNGPKNLSSLFLIFLNIFQTSNFSKSVTEQTQFSQPNIHLIWQTFAFGLQPHL